MTVTLPDIYQLVLDLSADLVKRLTTVDNEISDLAHLLQVKQTQLTRQ